MDAVLFRREKGLVFEKVPLLNLESDQVLVAVSDTGFCGSDHSLIETEGTPDGTILGHEISGIVEEVGRNVKDVKTGTRVIIRPTFCGKCLGCQKGMPELCSGNRRSVGIGDLPGGFAEYVTVFPQMLIPIPEGVDSENAALAELFAVGLHAIHQVQRSEGSALVIGAGAVGLALVKLLKINNFGPIFVSEPVEEKRKLAELMGADYVFDPTMEDIRLLAFQKTKTFGFETVFECSGVGGLLQTAMDVAAIGSVICQLSVVYKDIAINPATLMFKELKLTSAYGNTHEENIHCLNLMAEKKLDAKPIISDRIRLEQLPDFYKSNIHPGKAIKVLLKIGKEF